MISGNDQLGRHHRFADAIIDVWMRRVLVKLSFFFPRQAYRHVNRDITENLWHSGF